MAKSQKDNIISQINNTYVNGIIGKLGRGKTLSAVALAWISKYKFNTKHNRIIYRYMHYLLFQCTQFLNLF